jgi:radical SAM superfamily enzyme YgiQ (UPF0313 family)
LKDRILLINANTCSLVKVYPIGLDYLTSVLENNSYEVEKLDLAFINQFETQKILEEKIFSTNYLAIGISIRNLYDEVRLGKNYLPYIIKLVKQVKMLIKKYSRSSKIILGGAGFSLLPNLILKKSKANYGIIGQGELGFLNILKKIKTGQLIDKITIESVNLDHIVYQRGVWGNFHQYFKSFVFGNLQTKRGCPMNCLYCEYPNIEGKEFHFRLPKIVAQEFLQLEKLGFPAVYIVDATFNHPLDQAKLILKELKKYKTTKPWTGFLNPKFIDDEFLELIKKTNIILPIKLNIESGSDIILQKLRKNYNVEDIKRAVKLCRQHQINFSFSLLFGGPSENKKTVLQTINLVKECRPEFVSMSIGIFILPNTGIGQETKDHLWKQENDFLKPIIYPCQKDLIKQWIEKEMLGSGIDYKFFYN